MKAPILAGVLVLAAGAAAGARGGTYSPPPGDSHPVWSPDGSAIVYATRRAPESLRVINPDGSGDRLLPLLELAPVGPPTFSFSPGWFWIAFGGPDLVVLRPDGSERRRLSDTFFGSPPAWSPDDRRLAFPRRDGLYVIDVDGSNLRLLTTHGGGRPTWSPDGELIAFTGGPTPGEPEILTISPDGTGESVLTAALPGEHRDAIWSPDGRQLAFATSTVDPQRRVNVWQLTVMSREGTLVRQLPAPIPLQTVAWAPNGRELLVSGYSVWSVDVVTGEQRVVSPFGAYAAWSPDGAAVAFAAGGECADRIGIYRVAANGGAPTRLTNDCRIFGGPSDDWLSGTEFTDILLGLGGDDHLFAYDPGYTGDRLDGGPGADELVGREEADVLDGGPGADVLEAGPSYDVVRGGPGRDVVRGQGGRDQVFAADGTRDVVSCGTNRSRSTGPERDTAFVDRLDAVSGDCELVYRSGRVDLRRGRTMLTVHAGSRATPAGPEAVWTLRCRPAGGTLPNAAGACRDLSTMRAPLAALPYDRLCAVLEDPAGAQVTGLLAGMPVLARFNRRTTCEAERWDRHRFLLEPR